MRFDLGGDSLKAIEFLSEAHNEGIYFTLQSIFDHPSVRQLAEHIKSGNQQTVSFSDVDFTGINKTLEKNKIEHISIPQRAEIGNLLLTGATGYLGIHILAEYVEHEKGLVYCLVRGKNQEDSEQRLDSLLNFYFGDRYAGCERIKVLCADLQKERFGLSEQEYMALIPTIGMVINSAAASVKHYGSYQYFKEANIDTTTRIIRFCQASGAKLLHISSLSVSGNSFDIFDGYVSQEEKHFHESDLYIGQPLENVYARSKFEAERMVLEAIGDGLQANILRMGNLTSRLSDGVFQKNYESNAFLKRVKSMLELGVIPDYLLPHHIGFTPIDETANAVMTIASHFNTQQTVFHISSTKLFHVGKLVEDCRGLGFPMRVVSGKEFTVELQKTMEENGMKHIFETFITDLDSNGQLTYDSRIRLKSDFTGEYLNRLGFVWSELGIEYLRKYFKYLVEIGYLQGGEENV